MHRSTLASVHKILPMAPSHSQASNCTHPAAKLSNLNNIVRDSCAVVTNTRGTLFRWFFHFHKLLACIDVEVCWNEICGKYLSKITPQQIVSFIAPKWNESIESRLSNDLQLVLIPNTRIVGPRRSSLYLMGSECMSVGFGFAFLAFFSLRCCVVQAIFLIFARAFDFLFFAGLLIVLFLPSPFGSFHISSSRNFPTQRPRSTKGRSHKFAVIQETIHELQSLESVQHRRPWIIMEHEILLNADLNVDLWKWCEADTNLLSGLSLPSTQQPVENGLSWARTRRRQRLWTKRGQQAVGWNWST